MACRFELRPKRRSRFLDIITILASAAALGTSTDRASAGPNEGGTLILHANTSLVYTEESGGYCGQSGLTSCDQAVTSVSGTEPVVFFAIAAFPEGSSPRLMGLTFGLDYDPAEFIPLDWGSCGDFELPNEEWPAPGEGTAVTWEGAQADALVDVYWFAGYAYLSPTMFSLAEHPIQGGSFADDSIPAVLDQVVAYGGIGFGVAGLIPCPGLTDGGPDGPDDPGGAEDGGGNGGEGASWSVAAWGRNDYGQLDVPPPNYNFTAVATHGYHSLGLKDDGSIVAWGDNTRGQCNIPEPNTGFVSIAGGGRHSYALREGGVIVAWGLNSDGQCDVPAPDTSFVAVYSGFGHGLALRSTGSIVAWGDCSWFEHCNVPAPNSEFVMATAGGHHSVGLKSNGSIVAWGSDNEGQCDVPSPNANFVAVAAGASHTLALKADSSIVAFGWNEYGQCAVPSPNTDFIAIAAGFAHSLGLKADGSIVGWGDPYTYYGGPPSPNSGFVDIAAGVDHSLGLTRQCPDHELEAWNGFQRPIYQRANNCYNYATARHGDNFAQPGFAAGQPFWIPCDRCDVDCYLDSFTLEKIIAAVIADGLTPTTSGGDCGTGCKVALMLCPADGDRDYHFMREGSNLLWSHKPGDDRVTFYDSDWQLISNPAEATIRTDFGNEYSLFGGYFCVPPGVEVDGPGRVCCLEQACEVITECNCQLLGGIFHPEWKTCDAATCADEMAAQSGPSYTIRKHLGIPNQRVPLSNADEATITGMLDGISSTTDPMWSQTGKWYGFLLDLGDYEYPIVVQDGVIGITEGSDLAYYTDVNDIEGWLEGHASSVEQEDDIASQFAREPILWLGSNPLNRGSDIHYWVGEDADVSLDVFDVGGRRVLSLVRGEKSGSNVVTWTGRDSRGRDIASGVYIFRVTASGQSKSTVGVVVQ